MTFDEPVAIARFSDLLDREPVGIALFGDELTTFDRELHHLAGVPYAGVLP